MPRLNLASQLATPIVSVALVALIGFSLIAGSAAEDAIVEQESRSALARIDEIRAMRSEYMERVLASAGAKDLEAIWNQKSLVRKLPIPETMIHDLSRQSESSGRPVRVSLYSATPFPGDVDRELDEFARAALERFDADATGSMESVTEIDGERWIRVATADRMDEASCVSCHNGHPDSLRTDWQPGDVRGVIEVAVHVEPALVSVNDLRTRLALMSGGLALILFGVIRFATRRVGTRVAGMVEILQKVAGGELDPDLEVDDTDELDGMKSALDGALSNVRDQVESLHLFRTILEHAPVSFLLCDESCKVTYMNPHCLAMLDRLDISASVDASTVLGSDARFLFDSVEQMRLVLGDPDALPHRGLRPLGAEILDVAIDAIYATDGRPTGSLVTLELVTEEQETAIKLNQAVASERESGQQLREAAEREKERADRDHALAQELESKARQISQVMAAAASGSLRQRTGLRGDSPMDLVAQELDSFLDDLADRVLQIREMSGHLSEAGERLDVVGRTLLSGARRTTEEVDSVARAWRIADEGIGEIGSSVEGFSSSFEDITRNADSAVEVARAGVAAAEGARQAIQDLDHSTQKIDVILTVIDQIADQSKLLALNASIEAARAGDRGLGFNVVAQEVKKLAAQTEDATSEIAGTVAEILSRAESSVRAIHGFGKIIDDINESQRDIAGTVDAQLSTTRDIEAVTVGTRENSGVIAAGIQELSLVAESTQAQATGAGEAASKLLELAQEIAELTARFEC